MSGLPIVAIVGRPNVGKSTLFNRLIGRRQAIVHNAPGVTRDRLAASMDLDDGGQIDLIDTGGLLQGEDPLGLGDQVRLAIRESDAVVLVVDGREGLTAGDRAIAEELRSADRPILLAVNKGDTKAAQEGFDEFYALGFERQVLISAEHGHGIAELVGGLLEILPAGEASPSDAASLAIVGRPNVGKSSLLNRLLGTSRTLVSPVAGTTRDPVDSLLRRGGAEDLLLIDTAGIRRRSQASDTPEELAVMMARRQIARADVVAMVVDASQGVTSGDHAIAGAIWELGRAAVVVFNKWDLVDEEQRLHLEEQWPRLREQLREPPRINVSALTGRGEKRLLPAVDAALERFRRKLPTAELNRVLERVVARHSAPSERGRPWKLLYATQVSSCPPTVMLFANRSLPRQSPYRRYLERTLREHFDLAGIPVRLVIRRRSK